MTTIPQQFFKTAGRFARRPALRYKQGDAYATLRFSELAEKVTQCAAGLQQLGVEPEDKIAIFAHNMPEWVMLDLAAMQLGATVIPVHTTVSSNIIEHVLTHSGARVVFVAGAELWNKFVPISGDLPDVRTIITLDVAPEQKLHAEKRVMTFAELIKSGRGKALPANQATPDGIASIVYTSGTTGLPKGVMLTHTNFLFDAEAALKHVPVSEQDALLSFLPLSHVLERTAGYYAPLVCRGASIAYAENPKTLSQNLPEVKPTIIISVPRVFEKIYDGLWAKVNEGSAFKRKLFVATLRATPGTLTHKVLRLLVIKKIHRKLGGKLRVAICGGASLNAKLGKFFEKLDIAIVEGYGLTETSPVICCNEQATTKFGTVGKALPGVEVQIAQDKEVITRGAHIMRGYYKDKESTIEAIDDDGWFHTGDMGFIDDAGFLTIIGRKKEMMVTATGKNVWPESIELKINNDRLVAQSMVVGDSKKFVSALVVPYWPGVMELAEEQGIAGEPRELVKHPKIIKEFTQRIARVNAELADWEQVKQFRLLLNEFSQDQDELTPTLKLRRKIIFEHHKTEIEKMYQ